MFEPTSRYYRIKTLQLTMPDGRTVAYVKRRILPQAKTLPIQGRSIVRDGDRLDRITYHTLGDPEQFWQICDANNTMNPNELTAELDRQLRIPMPQA